MVRTTAITLLGLTLLIGGCNRSNQQPSDAQSQPVATIPEPSQSPAAQQTPLAEAPPQQAPAPQYTPPPADNRRPANPPRQSSPGMRQPPTQTADSGMAPRADSGMAPRVDDTPTRPANIVRKPSAPVVPPPPIVVPAGTRLTVQTMNTISTKTAKAGDDFETTLHQDLRVNNELIAPKGTLVKGRVVTADPGGRVQGKASISIELTTMVLANGNTIRISTSDVAKEATQQVGKDAVKVGIASGIGAAIGAIAGGGKGAAIGAGVGAGAGTAGVMSTRGEAASIPSESILTFALTQPIEVAR